MLEQWLSEKREEILKRWVERILETYPVDAQDFLKSQKNQFANPVGRTVYEGISSLLDELSGNAQPERESPSLDRMIRIRAVQAFSPSRAIGFIFAVKEIVREALGGKAGEAAVAGELRAFDQRVDELALLAFDVYMECREKMNQIRVNEVKNRTARLLEMANLVVEIPEADEAENGESGA